MLTPSLLACDFARMTEVFRELEAAGVAGAHMDGAFVPNLTYGPPVIASWRPRTRLPFDCHLMIQDPDRYADGFIAAGADVVLFHIEAEPDPVGLLRRIREQGCEAGLVLNPPTPVESVLPYLDEVDVILVMSVMPGFGGQPFQAAVLEKVRAIRAARPDLRINIDGGINEATAPQAVAAGATQLVAGSAVFTSASTVAEAVARLGAAAGRPPRVGESSNG
jgi:ribulose-phosphate 3-epimerase